MFECFETFECSVDYFDLVFLLIKGQKPSVFPLTLCPPQESKDLLRLHPPGSTLGVDLRRGHRRHSGTLQLPPLSWRQAERARSPDEDPVSRPSSLVFPTPPRINITPVPNEGWVLDRAFSEILTHVDVSVTQMCWPRKPRLHSTEPVNVFWDSDSILYCRATCASC